MNNYILVKSSDVFGVSINKNRLDWATDKLNNFCNKTNLELVGTVDGDVLVFKEIGTEEK